MTALADAALTVAAESGEEHEGIELFLPAGYDILWSAVVLLIIAVVFSESLAWSCSSGGLISRAISPAILSCFTFTRFCRTSSSVARNRPIISLRERRPIKIACNVSGPSRFNRS